jgi:hypothetical protein
VKNLLFSFILFSMAAVSFADTPPPGAVQAKMYSGDGTTQIGHTGSSINVNVSGGSGLTSTVNQGTAGSQSWLEQVTSSALPTNACQETGGNLAAILSKLNSSVAVTGTFWQATQPVSGSLGRSWSLLNTTDSVNAVQSGTWTSTVIQSTGANLHADIDNFPTTQAVSGTFWQTTQPVSASSLPLPSGASTSAKQPALGTAGTPSSDVISVQGVSSMTALKVDGSGVTQPVSGTFWQTTQPVSGTFWQTTQPVSGSVSVSNFPGTQPVSGTVTANIGTSGSLALNSSVTGLQVTQGSTTSGQSGTFTLGAVTSSSPSYTTGQTSPFSLNLAGGLRVDGSGVTQPVSGTFWQTTQPVSAASLPLPSGASTAAKQPALGTAGSASSDVISVQGIASMTALKVDGSGVTQPVSGTFWQATQPVSLTTLPALVAGSALVGKVGIDQTTVGTTNAVSIGQIGSTTAATGNGVSGTGTLRVNIASDNSAITVNSTPVVPTALTVKQATVTIGTTAVRLTNDGLAPASTRVLLVAQLDTASTANCFFGSSTVTATSTTTGVQMFPGQIFSFSKDAGNYYAICNTTSQTFHITEQE